ncbi:hypothetical protein CpB0512 [Chlamydia pneumoniae TW-183]|uniref:Uncharacterized protein n=2 Tax=Chlamydia pneumoniae TaxID=83558 RepID=Q9Z859_CHLPN|nr:hypothetical protein CPn_0492 [Chlamydia pneumoniae CWL029]AAF38124.1 hypothetical protein CP_0262 [Chlamydia pneumoniae AR39]AAP98441.1 hypothetical protein CpB0512 [Chlamydia pneumoniae TW-183]CRI33003.1 Uncharacterized protein BN1224_Wien1_A_05100 [Chlamydia pneumoniae]BAA98698.1 hypothetical protein [Chlamydia pneumoniae J138]
MIFPICEERNSQQTYKHLHVESACFLLESPLKIHWSSPYGFPPFYRRDLKL